MESQAAGQALAGRPARQPGILTSFSTPQHSGSYDCGAVLSKRKREESEEREGEVEPPPPSAAAKASAGAAGARICDFQKFPGLEYGFHGS